MRKILSILLVVCMILAIIPTAFALPEKSGDVEFITHEITLAVNEERILYLKSWPEGGVIWETNNSDVAYVTDGSTLHAEGIGVALITVTSEDTGNTDTLRVTVKDHYAIFDTFDWDLDGWTVKDDDGDGYSWMLASDYEEAIQTIGYDAAFCASYIPSEHQPLSSDDYLISPSFTIPFDAKKAELRFTAGALYPSSAYEELFVYIGMNWEDINDILNSNMLHVVYDVDYDEFVINIGGFIGRENVQVAFRYLNIDTYGLWLDNVGVYYEFEKVDGIVISDADINPVIGDKAGDHTYYTIPSDAKYSAGVPEWYNMTDARFMDDNDVFEKDKEYEVYWTVYADLGYDFAPDCDVTINGGKLIDWEYTGVNTNGYEFNVWTAPVPAQESSGEAVAITTAELNEVMIYPPAGEKAGDNLNVTLADGLPAALYDVYWYSESAAARMNDDEVFTVGNYYSMCIILEPLTGYKFTDETKIFINGSESNVDYYYTKVNDAGQLKIWTVSRACGEPVAYETIYTLTLENVTTAPPVGEKAGDFMNVTIPEGEHYKVTKVNWFDSTNNVHLEDEDVFEANTLYSIGISLVPMDGYLFADDVKIIINGKDNLLDTEYTEISQNNITIWTVDTESMDAPSVAMGDVNRDGKVNTADAVQVLKFAAEMITLDETQSLCADVNHDHKVNTADAVLILKYAAGMITEF